MYKDIKLSILKQLSSSEITLEKLLNVLFDNNDLKLRYTNDIRRCTIIGQIANEILEENSINNRCKILAIGDIKLFGEHDIKWKKLIEKSFCNINSNNLVGYDLTSQGSDLLRESLFNFMRKTYDFETYKNEVISSIIPSYGCTDGFVLILDSFRTLFSDKTINFYYPEASFMANVKIAEDILGKNHIKSIKKPSLNNFFITKDDISKIDNNSNTINIFYLTTVGNPTGTKIDYKELINVIDEIIKTDNNFIILDNVYVGLLKSTVQKELTSQIFNNKKYLDKIIFAESLSKTLGLTGIRVGWVWTLNLLISQELKRKTILKKAGFSKLLNEFVINLLSNYEEINLFQNEIFDFWTSQRNKFLDLIYEKYSHYFDFDGSSKVFDREGIYCLLKVKTGYTKEEIFINTGIIGVGIELSDGLYIRYAFANVNYF